MVSVTGRNLPSVVEKLPIPTRDEVHNVHSKTLESKIFLFSAIFSPKPLNKREKLKKEMEERKRRSAMNQFIHGKS